MQLFSVLLLLTFTGFSSAENESDLLSSIDIIVFEHSRRASLHWDCPRVGDRVAKTEEARIWQAVIPDARIEEVVVSSEGKALQEAEQYKWINEPGSNLVVQSSALLGMRKPDFDGSTAPVKMLYSKTRQINQDALLAMLPQLEQSKDKILEWMARTQASLPISKIALKIANFPFSHRFRVPQATSYHPRAFKHPYFTTGDLVAWMALAADFRQKGHADALKFFKLMVQSFLPDFSIGLRAVPASSAGRPTRTVYLHRSFQNVPAGADLAFYFDGNRGRFLKTQDDSIVLNRPEGIVDGQRHPALVLSSNANVDASSLEVHQTKADIAMQGIFCGELEKAIALRVPSGTTDNEVQTIGVSTIRSLAALLEQNSFLEAQRKVLESKPALLTELLPAKLVRLVIDYFSDDTYSFIVSTHRWSFEDLPRIAVDGARLYVMTDSEGLKGVNHSSAKEGERRYIEFGDPQWSRYLQFTSSHDGSYVLFSHSYKVPTGHGVQTGFGTKWLAQGSTFEGGAFTQVTFEGGNLPWELLSRNGQTLFSYSGAEKDVTRVYQIMEDAGEDPAAFMRLELSGMFCAVSGDGNCVMVTKGKQFEIYSIGKDASKLVCRLGNLGHICALNENGSEAAFVKFDELRIVEVDKVVGDKVEQPAIVTVRLPKSLEPVCDLVYSDGNKLHVRHIGGCVSLFDPSSRTFIILEAPHVGQRIIDWMISPNADYIALLQYAGKEETRKRLVYRTIVKRKLEKTDWRDLFGYEAEKDEAAKL